MKVLTLRSSIIFAVFVVLFVSLFVVVEWVNDKFWTNDLQVYYGAVNDFFQGKDPYLNPYGLSTGYFKYPPFTLYLLSPLFFLSFGSGQILHLLLSACSLIVAIPILYQICKDTRQKVPVWLLYFGFFSIVVPLARELHMGNVNLILLGLFSVGLYFLDKKNSIVIITWSLMIILKPIMILSLLPLFFYKRWKIILGCAIMGLFFILFPILHFGIKGNMDIWLEWIKTIGEHGQYILSNNSLRYLSRYYFNINSEWLPSLSVLILLIAILCYDRLKAKTNLLEIEWVAIFTAFIPNFFVTDTEHFLLSMPLIMLLMNRLYGKYESVFEKTMWCVFLLAIFLFSLNSRDLLGQTLDDFLSYCGAVGIGNLLFISLLIVYNFKIKKNEN